jgi:hypothetical protein
LSQRLDECYHETRLFARVQTTLQNHVCHVSE